MDRIDVDPGILRISEARMAHHRTGGIINALLDNIAGKALDGKAIAYNVPFRYRDSDVMFESTSFGDIASTEIGLHVDHNPTSRVASTKNALKVSSDDEGVFFRLDLPTAKNGHIVARMCEIGSRAATSVGCTIIKERKEVINGKTVRVVEKARLEEISICAQGSAGDNAFAYLVDKNVTPDPTLGKRTATFNAHQQMHKISRKMRDLKQQIAAMNDPAPGRSTARHVTIDTMNHWQTEETERLQALARRRC